LALARKVLFAKRPSSLLVDPTDVGRSNWKFVYP